MHFFYFKSFLRFLGRNRLYTTINVFGFSVSLMFVILIGAYTARELSVDRFHAKKDRMFCIQGTVAYPIGSDLKNRYPEIESYVATDLPKPQNIEFENQKVRASVMTVDSSFFSVFSFDLKDGTASEVFRTRNSAVITESFARKIAGDHSPVGQLLTVGKHRVTITGVARDFRHSAVPNADVLLNSLTMDEQARHSYGTVGHFVCLLARPNADLEAKAADMTAFLKTYYWKASPQAELKLVPIVDAYMTGNCQGNSGNMTFVRTLLSIGLLILLFAVINHINMSLAQSGFRSREMATRRLLGESRFGIFRSMIGETALLCAFSFALGLLLAFGMEDFFNRIFQTRIDLAGLLTPVAGLGSLAFVGLLSLVSGSAPAAVISRFRPIEAVRGTLERRTKMVYSKVLIAFQYFITTSLIGCSLAMSLQIRHMIRYDLGFDTEQMVVIENECPNWEKTHLLMTELDKIGGVTGTSLAGFSPLLNIDMWHTDRSDPENPVHYRPFFVDSSFFRILDIDVLLDNRQSGHALWLNEEAFRVLGIGDEATAFTLGGESIPIAGKVRNFRFRDLSSPILPAYFVPMDSSHFDYLKSYHSLSIFVKIAGDDPAGIFDRIRKTYARVSGGEPFEASFADRKVRNWYEEQRNMSRLIGSLTLVAIVISTLGMLAMSTYFIRQRSKEIAIRKIYGSTESEVLRRLIGYFMRLVAVGLVCAVPIIWYAMSKWLESYTEKIRLSWMLFAIAGLAVFMIALLTVYWQSCRAANANPVDSVKK